MVRCNYCMDGLPGDGMTSGTFSGTGSNSVGYIGIDTAVACSAGVGRVGEMDIGNNGSGMTVGTAR